MATQASPVASTDGSQHLALIRSSIHEELQVLQADGVSGDVTALRRDLEDAANEPYPDALAALIAIRSRTLPLLPADILRRKAWAIRDEFARVAGPAAYQKYLDSQPPDAATADQKVLAADLVVVMGLTAGCHRFIDARRRILEDVRRYGLITIGILALVAVLMSVAFFRTPGFIIGPILVLGALGAAVSVLRRLDLASSASPLDADPAASLAALASARRTSAVSLCFGAIFALLLYVVFAAQLLPNGGPFPAFDWPDRKPGEKTFLFEFMQQGSIGGYQDVGKVLVWSFIAGFAERFVPDVLDRLSKTGAERG